jgi:hypothetical protein
MKTKLKKISLLSIPVIALIFFFASQQKELSRDVASIAPVQIIQKSPTAKEETPAIIEALKIVANKEDFKGLNEEEIARKLAEKIKALNKKDPEIENRNQHSDLLSAADEDLSPEDLVDNSSEEEQLESHITMLNQIENEESTEVLDWDSYQAQKNQENGYEL